MNNLFFDISLVIPCYENFELFRKIFNSILLQKTKPKEIIIVDSSITNKIEDFINLKKKYIHDINIIYFKGKKLYPGKARNIGVNLSNYEWIGFIDSKTIALKNWLQDYKEILKKNDFDVVFGSTRFFANEKEKISNLFLQSTYGNAVHQTVPGTLIKKNIFKMNQFLENVRSGEDVFWREKLVNNIFIKYYSPDNYYLKYVDISNNFYENLKKHFLYSIHTSIVSIKNNIKDLYLSLFLILTALVVPKWNVLIGGWDTNPLYVPNITKLYILSLIFILLTYIIYRNLNFKVIKDTLFLKIIYIIIFIFITIFVIKWNERYSLIYYDVIFKFPHITKTYLCIIMFISIVFRGLYIPYSRKVSLKKLLFFNWIKIGIIGLSIDIIKSPAFIIGSFISIFKMDKYFTNKDKKFTKKMLVICPFPYDAQAGQRLKYEQHLKTIYLNGYDITISPFITHFTWKIIYKKGYNLFKFFALIRGYLLRLIYLFRIKKYDAVYIFMWVVPYTGYYIEYLYRLFSKKIIYDLEDNILIISKNEINPITSSFKSINKYIYLIKNSNHIISSSEYLSKKCAEINNKKMSTYICASIDLNRYKPIKKNNNKSLNIGWTGTFSTRKYLKIIEPTIQKISKIRDIKFIVIGDFNYHLEGVNVVNTNWNKKSEIEDLSIIDVGLYPLYKDEWVLGKSGLKALQYMALEIPAVATNYGNIKKIIHNRVSGFLIDDDEDWLNVLIELCDNIDLRKKIGKNGRKVVENYYSTDVIKNQYLKILSDVIN